MHRAPAGAKFGLREKQKYSPHPGGICISLLLEGSALLRSSRGHEANRSAERPGQPPAGPQHRAWGGRGHTAGHTPHCATISGGSVAGEGSGSALGRGWGRPRLEPGALEQSGDAGSPPPSTRAPPMPVPSDACPGPGSCPGAGTASCSLERPSHGLGHPPCAPPPPAGVPCVTLGGGNRVTGSDVSPPPPWERCVAGGRELAGGLSPAVANPGPHSPAPSPSPPFLPQPAAPWLCATPQPPLRPKPHGGGGWGEQQHRRASPEHPGKRLPIWRGNPGWGREDAQHPWELGTDAG